MEWLQVRNRIEGGEDYHTEFKRGPGDLKDVARAVCALANSDGGLVILGVDDGGSIVGVKEDAIDLQERLTSLLQTGCSSPVSARLGQHDDAAGTVHWIQVPRQRSYEPLRCGGRVFVRRERSSVEPSPQELQDLYNTFGYVLTEERAIGAADVGHIDGGAFREYLKALGLETDEGPQPATDDDLRNRGVVIEIDGVLRPTLYGILAFGRDPQAYPQTANFWVECVAYDGIDRASDTVLLGEAKGRLDEQVRRAVGWVQSGLGRVERYDGLIRKDHPLVPEKVLREALVNAVAHRDYAITGSKVLLEVFSDRVDITNPGTLPNHMTADSVRAGGHPRSRNESIANFLLVKKLMEQRGRGWPIMRRAMRELNGTEPELTHDRESKFVRVTLRLAPPV